MQMKINNERNLISYGCWIPTPISCWYDGNKFVYYNRYHGTNIQKSKHLYSVAEIKVDQIAQALQQYRIAKIKAGDHVKRSYTILKRHKYKFSTQRRLCWDYYIPGLYE